MKPTEPFKSTALFDATRPVLSGCGRATSNFFSVRFLVLAICSLGTAVPVRADVVFSDLGPGGSYQSSMGWTVYGPTAPIKTDRASTFVPLSSYTLDSIQAAFTWSSGVNAGDMYLMSDSGGLPGAVLESFHLNNLPAFGASSTALATAASTLHPLLSAGIQYWLVTSANDNSFLSFNQNNTGYIGLASRDNGGAWGLNTGITGGAFRVIGSPAAVPEPSTFALVGLAVMLMTVRFLPRYSRRPLPGAIIGAS